MATTRDQTSIEGALYDLCARGQKDLYFIKDEKDAVHPFQWTYNRWPASLPEHRWTNPLNQVKFGSRCEFEFDLPGDVLMEATLQIELPSWLPPEMRAHNNTTVTKEAGTADRVYGYVRAAAYFLFERIELYQDNVLLQEVSGDTLYFASLNKSSFNQGYLYQLLAGDHDGSALAIQRNATPGQLSLTLPIPGCMSPGDQGLPLCGLRQQNFRLRLTLRPLQQLVECNDPAVVNPAPWDVSFTQIHPTLGTITAPAVPLDDIGQPIIKLKTKQLYLLNDARYQLGNETVEVPYIRYFENRYSGNALDYAPLAKGGTATLSQWQDATYTVERMFTYFRNTIELDKNRLWNITNLANPSGNFYNSIQLTIAGQLREGPWGPSVWEQVVPHAKEDRYGVVHLPEMNWARGWRIEDMPPTLREPTGGINFSTADRPTYLIGLTDIATNPCLGYKQMQQVTVCESWALYKIEKGRGRLKYNN